MATTDYDYKKENYDSILFRAKKGKRAEYAAAAAEFGLSQMEMIRRAIEEYINNHRVDVNAENAEIQSGDTDTASSPKRASYAATDAQNAALNAFSTMTPREREETLVILLRAALNAKSAGLDVGRENPDSAADA